ncbi:MAG: PIN domain-containing protein [Cyclobacteriaceae bacterium]|nr:PIN domain-containing protein [Cyclobacteriaceae bacterium]
MNEAILVDTSVWISFFKDIDNSQVRTLTNYISNDYPIYTCPTIVQEILQGVKEDTKYRAIKEILLAFNMLNEDALEMALLSANLYRNLRKKGITIRKNNDCLIAQHAIKYGLPILHQDRDFSMILDNYE